MNVQLVRAADDVSGLALTHAACFANAWSAESIRGLLATPGAFALATAYGFAMVRVAASEAEILTLAVRPEARRTGIGRALVAAAATEAAQRGAETLFLEVAVSNLPARTVYVGLGFVEAGRRQGYYASPNGRAEDALVLRASLPLSPLGKASQGS